MSPHPAAPTTRLIEHATCLACGCLCDDIGVVVEAGRVIEARNACVLGRPWFLGPRPLEGSPPITIDGRPGELDEAIGRAAEILKGSKAPLVWGLSGTTIEAVASALAIADRIGAVVDIAGSAGVASRLAAFQRVGQVSASLGEVKDRADLVIFWGVDPLNTHPRHWQRYSVEPKGRFVPEGRAGRYVVVVDEEPSETSRAADLFIEIDRDRQREALDVLRGLVRGISLDPDRSTRSTGLPFPTLEALAERMKAARYGAFFFGPTLGDGEDGRSTAESFLKLVRELNEGRRFVALELGEPGNTAGAASVLSWQAGAPSSVDYGPGYPRHLPGEATLEARLTSGDVDAVLIVADDPAAVLPPDLLSLLAKIPSIVVAPGSTASSWPSAVAFDVARTGIEAGGTVTRVDGLMLPLRPAPSPLRNCARDRSADPGCDPSASGGVRSARSSASVGCGHFSRVDSNGQAAGRVPVVGTLGRPSGQAHDEVRPAVPVVISGVQSLSMSLRPRRAVRPGLRSASRRGSDTRQRSIEAKASLPGIVDPTSRSSRPSTSQSTRQNTGE